MPVLRLINTTLFSVIVLCVIHGQALYEDMAASYNVTGTYGEGHFGGGVSFADFNQDGWDDLTFATQSGDSILFFINTQNSFQKIPALIDNTEEVKQLLWIDIDNDRDLDLYVSAFNGINRLYLNKGNLQLEDITSISGLPMVSDATHGACFGDVDNDGLLDLYVSNYFGVDNHTNFLYKNLGAANFADITAYANVGAGDNPSLVSSFIDYNNDGLQDIYVASDKYEYPNILYKNLGNMQFEDVSVATQSNCYMDAMNIGYADYDGDSDFDIYITNTVLGGNKLLNNKNNEFFEDVADSLDLDIHNVGWAANFIDMDNDQDLDLYICHNRNTLNDHNRIYLNKGDGTFFEPHVDGIPGDTLISYSSACGDLNNDGFIDIAINNAEGTQFQLLQNREGSNNYIKLKFFGAYSNSNGIGNYIEVFTNGKKQISYAICGTGYKTQNSLIQHFGLGDNEVVDSITVKWLSGIVDVFYNVPSNQVLPVKEGEHGSYYESTENVTICDGEEYLFFDSVLTESGSYTINTISQIGLDSIAHLNLEVLQNSVEDISSSICQGEQIIIGGQIYEETGQHDIYLQAANGCDSIIRLDLIVENKDYYFENQLCDGEYLLEGADTLSVSGNYDFAYVSNSGCDSLVHINLEIVSDSTYFENASICEGSFIEYNGLELTEEDSYVFEFHNSIGCDSTVILDLEVFESYEEFVQISIESGSIYSDIEILGDTIFTLFLTSVNGCDSIVNVEASILSSIQDEWQIEQPVTVFPNPVSHDLIINTNGLTPDEKSIKIYEFQGRELKNISVTEMESSNLLKINMSTYPSGMYFLTMTVKNQKHLFKILKSN